MLQQIKMLVLGLITLCRRALCCFTRRRKLSHGSGASSAAGDQLLAVNVIVERGDFATVPGAAGYNGQPGGGRGGAKERDWNSWDDSPRTVEEHIEQYRQRMAQPPTPPKEEPEPDFFSVSWQSETPAYRCLGTLLDIKVKGLMLAFPEGLVMRLKL